MTGSARSSAANIRLFPPKRLTFPGSADTSRLSHATIDSALSSEKKLECFLTRLAQADVSASSQNQAFNAIAFFYREVLDEALGRVDGLRAKRPVHERHAPSVAETQLLLQTIQNVGGYPTNLIARLLYGCGLRVSEPLNLRTKVSPRSGRNAAFMRQASI